MDNREFNILVTLDHLCKIQIKKMFPAFCFDNLISLQIGMISQWIKAPLTDRLIEKQQKAKYLIFI